MGPKWEDWSDPAKVCLITLPILMASEGAWAACANTIAVLDGGGTSRVFCRGTDGTNFIAAQTIMDPGGGNFAAVNASSQLLVSTGAIAVSSLPNPVTVTGFPNPTTVAGTITVNNSPLISSISNWSGFPNPITAVVTTMPNPTTVAGTITVNNSPLISSISNWSGFPNPVTVVGTLIQQDTTAFTPGTTSFSTGGGFFQSTPTNNSLGNLQMGGFQVTAQRALFENLRNSAGTEIATNANPVSISGAVTVPNPVTVVGVAGSAGLIQQDTTAFTPGTTSFTTGGGFFQSTPTNNSLGNLQMGGFQLTAQRALFSNLRNSAGTEIGTAANPISTVGSVTVNNASLTVSVSDTVTSVTVNNNPLISSISNFPNPVTVAGTLIQQDTTAFTPGTTSFGSLGGFFQTTATNNSLGNLQMGAIQLTAQRAAFSNLRNASGTEIGSSANPVSTTGSVTVNNATIAVTVPNPTTVVVSTMPNPATVNVSQWGGNAVSSGGVNGSVGVGGLAANAVAATGNPIEIGGVASITEPTATTTAQATAQLMTVTGKLVDQPWSTPEYLTYGTVSTTTTTAVTIISSPGASLRLYGWVECGRTDTGTSAVRVTLNDTAGSVFVLPNTGGGGGNNPLPPIPLQWGVNSAMTVAVSAATTTVFCSAQAFKSAI